MVGRLRAPSTQRAQMHGPSGTGKFARSLAHWCHSGCDTTKWGRTNPGMAWVGGPSNGLGRYEVGTYGFARLTPVDHGFAQTGYSIVNGLKLEYFWTSRDSANCLQCFSPICRIPCIARNAHSVEDREGGRNASGVAP